MFDSLIDRKDRQIPRAAEAAVRKNRLEASQNADIPIARTKNPVDPSRSRKMEFLFCNRLAYMLEERLSIGAQKGLNF
jgi:hypothetical protein